MKKIAAILALSASTLGLSAGTSFADYTLNILHFNDWHSRIEGNNKYESTCSAEEETKGECIGGAGRLITAIAQERKKLEGQNVLLLNAGDSFQGSLFYITYKGAAEEEFLNQMRPDAVTLGNHEFDDGESALVPYLDKAKFPIVSANVMPNDKSGANGKFKPSIVVEVGGQKIGIVGAVTNDTPELASPGPNVAIADDVKSITAEVEKLKGEGINKIIAVTHIGYNRERDVIAKIPGVDVVVGGHSHTLLSNTDPKAAGPYPTMVDNPDGYKVPVVQAASYSKYLGEFKVVFDDNGVVKEASGDPIYLDKSITPDPAVLARIKELGAPIEALKNKEVAETTKAIDGSRENCRARECEMGNLVSDAILDRVKGQGVEIVISNGGGLRASIDQGTVTMGEVLTVLPFQNTLATFKISGKDLVAGLENGLSQIEDGAGRFPQVAGLKYAFDKSVAPNAGRVKSVEVMENGAWAPINPDKQYLVATNNYVRQGGDGYKVFAEKATDAYDYGPGLEQVVADYLGAHRPYTPKLDGRITEIGATVAAAEPAKPAETAPAATAPAPEPAKPAETAPNAAETAMPALPSNSGDIAGTPPTVPTETATSEAAKPAEAAPATSAPAAEPAKPAETAPAEAKPAATSPETSHVIAAGDTYWDLAKKNYGDGSKWKLISEANKDYRPRRLPLGATLTIPPAAK
ncbi:LysM peptidoglycan-binding domain-containing protein [Mesorhizobium sp. M1C.F.Ca.ET.193.01.1.1]|uniref:bifunctional metallophosphatase/5'-nucleotidase n=1 Tax=unclassified Mesorhizobium TaxID=325217 RepID=UPI000FD4C8DB|nr:MULTISPECIES: bifunctional UDP-sugar hydrolase/5'-nucleotidase [unclassified Mesorhizobium]TGS98773.1 LysM peptidoglycan-binding domain-containing protein [bacterium M00.F.Ca.ET.177.01.1.1]TGQ52797.1 LysM peptidoglycan-binding domain-containing protein [Mesorhizobium sp. M1C.F.Ca.ET.210.01.1.1]TGQ70084.1 LysM peptidoglycan-binding domain-containing protein [Mesorhizobium sp. M1C.F.Ca.ET.212.01.1.1]TGR05881.1 LysM peptidoglycan-binding domain-containing protein [Mesorhizobium sp. M1C.F.Ca.ET.